MSAISKTSIANVAALALGNEPLQDIGEDSDFAILANNRFDYCLGAVARMHEWTCLTKRVILSPLTDSPEFDWDYQFVLPSDLIKILSVKDEQLNLLKYEPQGSKILSDYNVIYLKYIHTPTALGIVDHLFAEALGYYIAKDLAFKVTRDDKIVQMIESKFQRAMQQAKKEDFNENDKQMVKPDRLMSARHGYSRIHSQYVDSRNHDYTNLVP
jgi:hypothetical protein